MSYTEKYTVSKRGHEEGPYTAVEIIDLLRNGQGVLNILPLAGVKDDLDAKIVELRPRDAQDKATREIRTAGR